MYLSFMNKSLPDSKRELRSNSPKRNTCNILGISTANTIYQMCFVRTDVDITAVIRTKHIVKDRFDLPHEEANNL